MTFFDAIFQVIQEPMAITIGDGPNNRIVKANPAFLLLTGYSENELTRIPPFQLMIKHDATPAGSKSSPYYLLLAKNNPSVIITLTRRTIEYQQHAAVLLIAQDVSGAHWLHSCIGRHKPLIWGFVGHDLKVERAVFTAPVSLIDPNAAIQQQHIHTFIHEEDQERLLLKVEEAVKKRQTVTMKLRTKPLVSAIELLLTVMFSPFFHGDGSLKHFAFVLTKLQQYDELNDPAIRLKIAMARKNMSAQQLSKLTGISMQTISKLRNGKITKPARLTAELITSELQVKPDDIWDL